MKQPSLPPTFSRHKQIFLFHQNMNNRHTQDSAHSNCQTISINVKEHAIWLTHFPIKTARLQKDQFESLMFLFFSVCIYLCEQGRKKKISLRKQSEETGKERRGEGRHVWRHDERLGEKDGEDKSRVTHRKGIPSISERHGGHMWSLWALQRDWMV